MRATTIAMTGLALLLALLTVPATVSAAPAITIAPPAGPAGTTFVVTGTGFTVGDRVLLVVGNIATGERSFREEITIGADGGFQASINSAGYRAGEYVVGSGLSDGTALAQTTFTITDSGGQGAPPSVSISPSSGPAGTTFTVTGKGFKAGDTLAYVVISPDRQSPGHSGPIQAGPDGGFALTLTGQLTGRYVVAFGQTDGTILATGDLTITGSPTGGSATPLMTIAPSSGPAGTTFVFVVTDTGLGAGNMVAVSLLDPAGSVVLNQNFSVEANGAVGVTYGSSGDAPGTYRMNFATRQGTLFASGTFTITDAGSPSTPPVVVGDPPRMPPATGGGGMARQAGSPQSLLAGLGIVAFCSLVIGITLHRRAA